MYVIGVILQPTVGMDYKGAKMQQLKAYKPSSVHMRKSIGIFYMYACSFIPKGRVIFLLRYQCVHNPRAHIDKQQRHITVAYCSKVKTPVIEGGELSLTVRHIHQMARELVAANSLCQCGQLGR